MKKFIPYGLLLALLASSTFVSAMWVRFNDCDLIDSSELIVSAKFAGKLTSPELKKLNLNPKVTGLAALHIHKVYKGDVELSSVYIRQPSDLAAKNSNDIFFNKGQVGIWFLRRGKSSDGLIYYADHPQRYWPSSQEADVGARLKSCRKK